jgi:hypothetical protein
VDRLLNDGAEPDSLDAMAESCAAFKQRGGLGGSEAVPRPGCRLIFSGAAPAEAQKNSIDCLFTLYLVIEQAMRHLRGNASKQLTLEGVCLKIKDQLYGQGSWDSFSRGRQDLPF